MLPRIWQAMSKDAIKITLLFILILSLYLIYNLRLNKRTSQRRDISYLTHKKMKYILQWTRHFSEPFDYIGEGNSAFIKNKCKYTNCYVTDDSQFFLDLAEFDAVAFNGRDVSHLWPTMMPKYRTPKQKYIFGALESSDNFPACDVNLDGFFNWTWTYKLDSDFRWGYITIYDLSGNVVGPAIDMKWPSEMKSVSAEVKSKLATKSKAAAWFVSHCSTKIYREKFVEEIKIELKTYNWTVDVFGSCGTLKCPRSDSSSCFKMIEKDYYFYFSFENSFAEDYVTEKLLSALNNYAIPVVFGSANYSRYLPPGSYLNAIELGAKELARQMFEIVGNQSLYHDFFRWRNHFVYKETSGNADMCKLCEMMNDEAKLAEVSVWNDFRTWWNGARYKDNCG